MSQTAQTWMVVIAAVAAYAGGLGWLYFYYRKWDRKARTKRRLLVNEDGQIVWRVVRGKVLVGWPNGKGEISSGLWSRTGEEFRDYAVIQTAKGKFVVYRFDKPVADEPQTGMIEICDSWRALKSAVPPKIFEEALRESGLKKPSEYKEIPINL